MVHCLECIAALEETRHSLENIELLDLHLLGAQNEIDVRLLLVLAPCTHPAILMVGVAQFEILCVEEVPDGVPVPACGVPVQISPSNRIIWSLVSRIRKKLTNDHFRVTINYQ